MVSSVLLPFAIYMLIQKINFVLIILYDSQVDYDLYIVGHDQTPSVL